MWRTGMRLRCAVFRAGRIPAGLGRRKQTFARELVPAGVGMFPDLLRVGGCEDHGWRPAVAQFYGAGRVLPERSAADVDWLVHAALAALDSCSDGVWDAGAGTGARVDDVSAEATANFVFSHHYAVADRHHPFGEIHFLELPGAGV